MRLIIEADEQYPHLDYNHLIMLAIQQTSASAKIREFIRQELSEQIPGYEFRVVILSGPY